AAHLHPARGAALDRLAWDHDGTGHPFDGDLHVHGILKELGERCVHAVQGGGDVGELHPALGEPSDLQPYRVVATGDRLGEEGDALDRHGGRGIQAVARGDLAGDLALHAGDGDAVEDDEDDGEKQQKDDQLAHRAPQLVRRAGRVRFEPYGRERPPATGTSGGTGGSARRSARRQPSGPARNPFSGCARQARSLRATRGRESRAAQPPAKGGRTSTVAPSSRITESWARFPTGAPLIRKDDLLMTFASSSRPRAIFSVSSARVVA